MQEDNKWYTVFAIIDIYKAHSMWVFQECFTNLLKYHVHLCDHVLTNQEFQNHTTNQERKQKSEHVAGTLHSEENKAERGSHPCL